MEPESDRRRTVEKVRKGISLDGVNLEILRDDYMALPVSAKEAAARQRCLALLAEAQAREEEKGRD